MALKRDQTQPPISHRVEVSNPPKHGSAKSHFFQEESRISGVYALPCWCGSILNRRGYAGFGPCFHLPGFHFGTGFLSHSHVSWWEGNLGSDQPGGRGWWRTASASTRPSTCARSAAGRTSFHAQHGWWLVVGLVGCPNHCFLKKKKKRPNSQVVYSN